jgi:hypothetical protein
MYAKIRLEMLAIPVKSAFRVEAIGLKLLGSRESFDSMPHAYRNIVVDALK